MRACGSRAACRACGITMGVSRAGREDDTYVNGLIGSSLPGRRALITIGTASVQFKHADTFLLAAAVVAFAAMAIGLWLWLEAAAIVPLTTLLLAVVLALLLHQFRVRERQDTYQLRQFQALLTLYALIPFRSVPPAFTGWAATPEFAVTLYEFVRNRRPNLVLELGSGASSVVMAAALEQNGSGRLVSIEQDREYAEKTRNALDRQGLAERAEVVHAPITSVALDDGNWKWYDLDAVPTDAPIDLLVIDGPHRELQKMARYPALPILFDRLASDAVIVVDDAHRKDERRAMSRWTSEFDGLEVEMRDSPKGTAVIRRAGRR